MKRKLKLFKLPFNSPPTPKKDDYNLYFEEGLRGGSDIKNKLNKGISGTPANKIVKARNPNHKTGKPFIGEVRP